MTPKGQPSVGPIEKEKAGTLSYSDWVPAKCLVAAKQQSVSCRLRPVVGQVCDAVDLFYAPIIHPKSANLNVSFAPNLKVCAMGQLHR